MQDTGTFTNILDVAAGQRDLVVSVDRETLVLLGLVVFISIIAGTFFATYIANKL
jgi:hypothetical protein